MTALVEHLDWLYAHAPLLGEDARTAFGRACIDRQRRVLERTARDAPWWPSIGAPLLDAIDAGTPLPEVPVVGHFPYPPGIEGSTADAVGCGGEYVVAYIADYLAGEHAGDRAAAAYAGARSIDLIDALLDARGELYDDDHALLRREIAWQRAAIEAATTGQSMPEGGDLFDGRWYPS